MMVQDRKGASAIEPSRRHLGVAVLTGVTLALSACSGGASSGGDGANPTVGFSAGVLDNPFTAGLVDSVVTEANSNGLNMLPASNAEGDPAKQVTDINTL